MERNVTLGSTMSGDDQSAHTDQVKAGHRDQHRKPDTGQASELSLAQAAWCVLRSPIFHDG